MKKFISNLFNNGPPNIEGFFRRIFGNNNNTILNNNSRLFDSMKKIITFVVLMIIIIWSLIGFYIVQPAEQSAVLFLGKLSSIQDPGIHWEPPGLVNVIKKNVERLNTIKLDKQMLTSEENMVHVSFSVQYRINNLEQYLFYTSNPELILKQSLESSVRKIIGKNKLENILTTSRTEITFEVQKELETLLKKYQTGILVNQVIMQPAQAPYKVKNAFDDVIKAREDRERIKNQAQIYANNILPVAKGKAQRILDEARAYQEKIVLEAEGNVENFNYLLPLYQDNPKIIENQLYFQTIENIFKKNKLYIMDKSINKNIFLNDNDKNNKYVVSSNIEQDVLNNE